MFTSPQLDPKDADEESGAASALLSMFDNPEGNQHHSADLRASHVRLPRTPTTPQLDDEGASSTVASQANRKLATIRSADAAV